MLPEDLRTLKEKGVIVIRDFFSPAMKARLAALGKEVSQAAADGTVSRNLQFISNYGDEELKFIPFSDEIKEMAGQIFGQDVAYYLARILMKDKSFTGNVVVHQDWPYFGGNTDKTSIFVPLSRCNEDNGMLVFYEGSHWYGPVEQGAIDVERFPDLTPICPDIDVGDILVAHALTWHASVPAKVERDRIMVQCFIHPADDPTTDFWRVILGEGKNRVQCPNRSFPMSAPIPSISISLASILMKSGQADQAERIAKGVPGAEGNNVEASLLLYEIEKSKGGSPEQYVILAKKQIQALSEKLSLFESEQ